MKYTTLILITILSALMIHCASPKKAMYELPVEMAEAIRSDYAKQCDKGQILYNINCGGCHTNRIKGKDIIPDFTSSQLVGYGLRVTNARHETNITDEAVSTEELGLIMTFLTYKKKNPAGTVVAMPKL